MSEDSKVHSAFSLANLIKRKNKFYFSENSAKIMGNGIVKAFKPEVTPGPYQEPSFDVMYGFPEGRKERGLLFSLHIMSPPKRISMDFLMIFSYDCDGRTNEVCKASS